jgi:hypothetical protein
MRCLRALFHEETALLSVRKIPFPELTPKCSSTSAIRLVANVYCFEQPAWPGPSWIALYVRCCYIYIVHVNSRAQLWGHQMKAKTGNLLK